MFRKVVSLLAALALFVVGATAQTNTLESVHAQANVGDAGWSTFIFGHEVNGEPGTTELIVQCGYNRAELITNFDVYGQQLTSQFFAVTCSESASVQGGYRVLSFSLNGVPLHESLVMTGRDGNGQPVTQNLNLTVNNATWEVTNPGRWQKSSGASEIIIGE